MKPFSQLPLSQVPETPRKPHPYFNTKIERLRFTSEHFGDVEVVVRVYGQGPPLLLVHGFMTSSYSWRYVLEDLGERFTLYIPDLIGAGESSKPDRYYGPDELALCIGETIDALGINGAPAIGNSLGGYLCMRLALLEKEKISRLVNLHSPGIVTPRMRLLRLALQTVPKPTEVIKWLVWRDPERWVHKNVHYFDETLKSREEHRIYAAPLRTPEGVKAFARMLSETLNATEMEVFEKKLITNQGGFPIPLWLVYAERDPMVPPTVGDRLRDLLPNATFIRLTNASHFAHVDSPGQFLAAIEPFLKA